MWVKISYFPDSWNFLAFSVKISRMTFEPYLLNKQTPAFELLNISPIVLSSNGTTVGLSF